jgi:hypothetical protein
MTALSQSTRRALAAGLCNARAADEIADVLEVSNVLSSTEAGYLDGVTAGTSTASKAVVVDSSHGFPFLGRITTTDGVASGTAGVVGRLLYANTAASTAVASTSAETAYSTSYTMPADTLKAGSVVKIRYQGVATTAVGSDTMVGKLLIGGVGGTALVTTAATTIVNAHTFTGESTLICRTAGTTGTFVAISTFKVNSAEGTMTVKDDITASTTINTTAAQVIAVSVTYNTTNANSSRIDVMTVEIY